MIVNKNMEGKPPPENIPHIWCDFNAFGLSGEKDDNCYYSLHREILKELSPIEGTVVFIYENDLSDDGQPEIFGYIAKLEITPIKFNSKWRARPDEETWYRGPCPW